MSRRLKPEPELVPAPIMVNNQKAFLQKVIVAALTLIIGLIATVWAITWSASESRAAKTDAVVKENTQAINEIKIFIAQQALINENTLKLLEEIQKK